MKEVLKISSIILIIGVSIFVIPETFLLFDWIETRFKSGFFSLVFPFNFLLIVIAFISTYSFKSKLSEDKTNSLLMNNLIGLLTLGIWLYFYFK